ncbi:MAG TPA: peptidylprolyl isomerase [Candidatus Hypogeohydataceae bacterium YC40]
MFTTVIGRFVYILGVILLVNLVCSSLASVSMAESVKLGAIRAVVNGVIITDDDVKRRAINALREASEKYKGREFLEKAQEILNEVLDELIDRQLLVQEAKKVSKDNPNIEEALNKEVDALVKEAVDKVGSLSRFYEIATKEGINPVEKKKELKEDLMAETLLKEFAFKKISISPKEVRDYYLKHRDEFNEEREVKVRQILIRALPDPKEAEKKAQEVYQRAKAGEDFAEFAKQFSVDPRASSGGLWENNEIKQWVKELREPALALDQGEISQPIRSSVGFHIFKAEAVKPAKTPTFEEIQEDITNKLYQDEARRRKKEYIQSLKQKASIKIMK